MKTEDFSAFGNSDPETEGCNVCYKQTSVLEINSQLVAFRNKHIKCQIYSLNFFRYVKKKFLHSLTYSLVLISDAAKFIWRRNGAEKWFLGWFGWFNTL